TRTSRSELFIEPPRGLQHRRHLPGVARRRRLARAGARWQLFLRAERREASPMTPRPKATSSLPAAGRCSPTAISSTDDTTIRTPREDQTDRPAAGWRMA